MGSLGPDKINELEKNGVLAKLHELDVDLIDCLYDPTLADCLIRDIKDELKADKLRQALKERDVSTAKLLLYRSVMPTPEVSTSPAKEDEFTDDEDDQELQRLRETRLRQMRIQARVAQERALEGYGRLNEATHPRFLLRAIEDASVCVCHVSSAADRQLCGQLDETLEGLAHRFPGTFFARLPAELLNPATVDEDSRAAAAAVRGLLPPEGAPALLLFRRGALIAGAPLRSFGDGLDLREEQVVKFLRRSQVLSAEARTGGAKSTSAEAAQRTGGASNDGTSDSEEEEHVSHRPCETCGRRYPHEHVRAVGPKAEDADEEEDED